MKSVLNPSSKLLDRKWKEQNHEIHLQRLRNMTSIVKEKYSSHERNYSTGKYKDLFNESKFTIPGGNKEM